MNNVIGRSVIICSSLFPPCTVTKYQVISRTTPMRNIAEMIVQEEPLSHRKWGRSGTRTGDNGINDAQGVRVTRTGAGEHPTRGH